MAPFWQQDEISDNRTRQKQSINPLFKRSLKAALNCLLVIVFLFVLFLAYGVIPNRWYHVLYVYSGSMEPTIQLGDVIIITPLPDTLEPGMIVSMSVNDSIVTHRIVSLRPDGVFLTRGDANNTVDKWDNSKVKVLGLYKARIPYLGYALASLQSLFKVSNSGAWFVDQISQRVQADLSWGEIPTLQPGSCTYSIGFWKNHPDEWPVEQITIGEVTYSKGQAILIFKTPPTGDATYILASQLIAAKLNILNGADDQEIAITVDAADRWLANVGLGNKPGKSEKKTGVDLAEILDDYNNGIIGPGHCNDEVIDFPPTTEPTVEPTDIPTDEMPTPTQIIVPTETPVPTSFPTATPTPTPTGSPTYIPTYVPTDVPTSTPTDVPTDVPTSAPTDIPTATPTPNPTDVPTDVPTDTPIDAPTDP